MAKLGDLIVNIGANTKDLNKKLGKVRRDMRSMSSNFAAVGKNMTRNLTMPLALVGGAAVKLAVDFESAMAQVKSVSGATGSEFKKLEQSAKDLGASTVFTAREVAALQLEYSRLGFSADEITQVQEATLNLAQATGSDLAQAAEVAGATLRAFGLDASTTGDVTDVMAESFSASALDINTFQESMKHVAPIAKAAGVSLEETSAMLAVLANSGIKGSQAGTALRRILQEMQGTSGTLTERFAELAAKGIGVEGAMDEVGRRAATSLLVLTEGAGQVDQLTGSFENSEGAAKRMADVMNDTAQGQLKQMTSALEGAGIALGEVLIPFITKAAGFVTDLATRFKNLSVDTQQNIAAFGAIVAALGPLLVMLPNMIAGFTAMRNAFVVLNATMLANPFIAIAAGATALTLALVSLTDTTSDAKKNTQEFISTLDGLEQKQKEVGITTRIELLKTEKVQLEVAARAEAAAAKVGALGDKFDKQIASGNTQRYTEQAANLAEEIALLNVELDNLTNPVEKVAEVIDSSADTTTKATSSVLKYVDAIESIPASLIEINGLNKELQISTTNVGDTIEEATSKTRNMQFAILGLAETMGGMFSDLVTNAATGANAFKQFAIRGMRAAIALAKAQVIANATGPNAANVASGGLATPAFIVAGLTMLDGFLSTLPALAEGGLAFGPTTALIGDNKNARIDPEVVAPLSKLRDMLGGGSTNVYGRISGDDIVISNDRAMRDRNRYI